MTSELNRPPSVPPVVADLMPVHTDTSNQPSDATSTGQNALLFRDNLMGGIASLNQNVKFDVNLPTVELFGFNADEQPISFAPPAGSDTVSDTEVNEQQPLPERPQPPTPQQIAAMITNLDSQSYPTRAQAQHDIQTVGAAALPQLLQAIDNPASLEVRRRAEQAVRRITDGMSTEQLLALRDPAQRQQAIRDGVTAPPTAEQTQRLNTSLEAAARSGMESRLTPPTWLNDLYIGRIGKQGNFDRIPTEATVSQFDRMATPEGRQQATQRLTDLTRMLSSENITASERETITRQIGEIARVSSPEFIANGRVQSRLNLAEQMSRTGGDPQRIATLMLQAHQLSERPAAAPQGVQPQRMGQQPDVREGVRQSIVQLGLDQNPAFMQQFQAQAGQAETQAIQAIRTQLVEQQRMEAEQRQLDALNPPKANQ